MKRIPNRKFIFIILVTAVVLVFIVSWSLFSRTRYNILPQIIASNTTKRTITTFPKIDEANLSLSQKAVISILETEYKLQPIGTKYSEGVDEAWCADFVSWVFKQAGVPLSNPNNSYWRIPGTKTLKDYYVSVGKFKSAQSDYTPKVGDIMIYDNPSPFGQHTNIVIENTDGIVTTIGGNEPGGIRIIKHTTPDGLGFIGYGVF